MKLRHVRTVSEKYSYDDSRGLAIAYIDSLPKFTCHDMSVFMSIPHIGIMYIPALIGYRDQLIYLNRARKPLPFRGGDELRK